MKCQPINKNLTWFNVNKMKIFVNIKNSVSNWVLNNANEKLKYTVITFCYISCFSHSLDGRSYSVMTVYLTIFFFFSYVVVLRYIGKILIPSLRRIFSLHYRFYYNVIVFGVWKDFLLLLKKYFTITLSFQIAVFHRFLEEMVLFCNTFFFLTWYMPDVLERFYQFTNFLLFCMLFRVLAKHLLHSQVPHFYFSNSFIEIKHLPCYIFILFHLPQIPRKNHVTSPQ